MIDRLRREDGFGLIELITALVILNVALFAMFAMFNAGVLSIARASRTTTASILSEKQMELYRSLKYDDIGLESSLVSAAGGDATHTSNTTEWNSGSQVTIGTCTTALDQCKPIRTNVSGPDSHLYRIDTYIRSTTPTNGRPVKQVTVTVRRQETLQVLAKLTAAYDKYTGCTYASSTGACT